MSGCANGVLRTANADTAAGDKRLRLAMSGRDITSTPRKKNPTQRNHMSAAQLISRSDPTASSSDRQHESATASANDSSTTAHRYRDVQTR